MKKSRFLIVGSIIVFFLGGLWYWYDNKEPVVGHNDLDGKESIVFRGTTPCADCPGIDTTLTLNEDGTFTLSTVYLERNESKPFVLTGSWRGLEGSGANTLGTIYELKTGEGDIHYYREEGENVRQLDQEGNEIESNLSYTLVRQL
jgi:uncharacterized lipoprotein NlpE involved in copper resistance